mmetsp:Transcript_19801/g.22029  ORF Transcript_19801/g.22029 Transcript_19801/m.22029 type:complete len:164 (-) Transcript_19801:126-617(-)
MFLSGDSPDKVIDNLYICSFYVAASSSKISHLGITHVINVCEASYKTHLEIIHEPLSDFGESALIAKVPRLVDFIDNAIKNGGNVLVHCMAGVNRSASVILCYLMSKKAMPLNEAFKLLSAKRKGGIQPHTKYFKQLMQYEKDTLGSNSMTVEDYERATAILF